MPFGPACKFRAPTCSTSSPRWVIVARMIDPLKALLLGLLQGATEFIPVSSSAHLVIAQKLLGFTESPLLFDVVLHLGTFLATIIVFRRPIRELLRAVPRLPAFGRAWFQKGHLAIGDDPDAWLLILIAIVTVITGGIGIAFHDEFERMFDSMFLCGLTLILTGALLFAARRIDPKKGKTAVRTTFKDAVILGLAQAAAIVPGLSRSGTTISTGLFLGFSRPYAGEFSFLISLPAIGGAVLLEALKADLAAVDGTSFAIGFVASFALGWLSLTLLLRWIRNGKLLGFAVYCVLLGCACFFLPD